MAKRIDVVGPSWDGLIGTVNVGGDFEQELRVYGRGGAPCKACGTRLKEARIGQRSSAWCPRCQR